MYKSEKFTVATATSYAKKVIVSEDPKVWHDSLTLSNCVVTLRSSKKDVNHQWATRVQLGWEHHLDNCTCEL